MPDQKDTCWDDSEMAYAIQRDQKIRFLGGGKEKRLTEKTL